MTPYKIETFIFFTVSKFRLAKFTQNKTIKMLEINNEMIISSLLICKSRNVKKVTMSQFMRRVFKKYAENRKMLYIPITTKY